MLRDFILVAFGGAAGSVARYAVSLAISRYWARPFPLAILLINLAGCLAIGMLAGIAARNEWMQRSGMWLLLATGLCGGFTTFSAFALDNVKLLEGHLLTATIVYLVASIVGGILLCRIGMQLMR